MYKKERKKTEKKKRKKKKEERRRNLNLFIVAKIIKLPLLLEKK